MTMYGNIFWVTTNVFLIQTCRATGKKEKTWKKRQNIMW